MESLADIRFLTVCLSQLVLDCVNCRVYLTTFKLKLYVLLQTDPQNTDYTLEAGATRNFEALRTAELQAVKEQKEKEAEESNNPMKVCNI